MPMTVARPVRLAVAVVIAALAVWKLVVPGVWVLANTGEIDRDVEAKQRRELPIMGTITKHRHERSKRRRGGYYTSEWIYAEATPPGAKGPVSTDEVLVIWQHEGMLEVGDPVRLWYDPEHPDDKLSAYSPAPGGPSIGWMSLLFLIPGAVALIIVALLVRSSLVRTPAAS